MRTAAWLEKHTKDLHGKRIAVTGSTGGLGRELCAYLASAGASLVLLDRNESRSRAHADDLTTRYGVDVGCVTLDLEDLSSARSAVEYLERTGIDIFIHNAGAYSIPRHLCASGYENVFQINFATPYYMIRELLPMLRARQGRVIAVGSIAHRYSATDAEDVDFRTRKASSLVYGNAKRYLMFALHELLEKESDVRFALTHPGITFTNITAHYPKVIFAIIKHPMKVIFMRPARAALSILCGAFSETRYGEWIGPAIFDVWGLPKKKTLRPLDEEERRRIAETAETVYRRCKETAERTPKDV